MRGNTDRSRPGFPVLYSTVHHVWLYKSYALLDVLYVLGCNVVWHPSWHLTLWSRSGLVFGQLPIRWIRLFRLARIVGSRNHSIVHQEPGSSKY